MDMEVLTPFIKESCMMCGSQRCDPSESEWREGCSRWREYKQTLSESQLGNSPKTIFIVQPMSGLTIDQILEKRMALERLANQLFNETELIFIDSFNPEALDNGRPLEELGECIKLLEDADIVFIADGWENSKGCQVEQFTAKIYGKTILYEKGILSQLKKNS